MIMSGDENDELGDCYGEESGAGGPDRGGKYSVCSDSVVTLLVLMQNLWNFLTNLKVDFSSATNNFAIKIMGRFRPTTTATSHISNRYKSDDDEIENEIQFQFQIIFGSQLFSQTITRQCRWQQRQPFTRWTESKHLRVLLKKCSSNPANKTTIWNCI